MNCEVSGVVKKMNCEGGTLELATIAVGAPESGYCPWDWRHSPPGEAAMADEATTTKWNVKHGPTERRHESQRDASNQTN